MTRDAITVGATDSILDVMELMVAKRVGRVIITEKQLPVGIFTEQDVLKRVVNKKLDAKKTSIKKVMTTPIHAVREEASIVDVLGKMYKGKFRHLLVRGEKKAMVGLVSMRRILKLAVELEGGACRTRDHWRHHVQYTIRHPYGNGVPGHDLFYFIGQHRTPPCRKSPPRSEGKKPIRGSFKIQYLRLILGASWPGGPKTTKGNSRTLTERPIAQRREAY